MVNYEPIVSVLMTAYNREKYIAEAIESVLNSTFQDFELIIVDDCSSDRTVQIAKEYEIKDSRVKVYVNETNIGDYPNRNKAAEYAIGKYIKYLDSDDKFYKHGLEIMVSSMCLFPNAGFGLCSEGNGEKSYPLSINPYQIYMEHFQGYYHFSKAPGSAIFLRSAFISVDGFSGKRHVGDFELLTKLSFFFDLVKFQKDLYWDRVHDNRESNEEIKFRKVNERIRKKILIEALNSPFCPLNENEKIHFLKKIKIDFFKKRCKEIILNIFQR